MTNDASEWVAITPLKPKLKILIFALSIHSQNEISYYLTQFSLLRCKWIPNCFSSQKDILKVESLIISVHHHCWRLSQLMGNIAIINIILQVKSLHISGVSRNLSPKSLSSELKLCESMQSRLNFYWKCFLSQGAETEGGTEQRRPSESSGDSHTCPQQTPTTGHWLLHSGSCSLTINIFQTLVSSTVKNKTKKSHTLPALTPHSGHSHTTTLQYSETTKQHLLVHFSARQNSRVTLQDTVLGPKPKPFVSLLRSKWTQTCPSHQGGEFGLPLPMRKE